jgi:hypothetical protein
MILSNNYVDFWFEDIKDYLTSISYEEHDLTIELIKYNLLHDNLICYKCNKGIILGMPTQGYRKEFLVVFISGKFLKSEYLEFTNYLKDNGFSMITAKSNQKISNYFKILSNKLSIEYENKYTYDVDLSTVNYDIEMQEVTLLDNRLIDIWWPTLDLKLDKVSDLVHEDFIKNLKFQLQNNQLLCYKLNKCVIIGYINNTCSHKQFFILYMAGHDLKNNIRIFWKFISNQGVKYTALMCDKVRSRLYDKIAKDYVGKCKKQICNFFSL